MNKEDIKELIYLMKEENMEVISIETDEIEIYLKSFGASEEAAGSKRRKKVTSDSSSLSSGSTAVSSGNGGELIDIKADQIGTFYTQPEEDSDETFVSVGDQVKPGDQVGLIETMKIFNEFLVEDSGTVEEILVSNGEAVEYGQVVMRLRSEEA